MPKLSQESLCIFPPAFSMATSTTPSVLGIMSQATIADPSLSESGPSLLTVFKKAGYRTVWLTNQGSMMSGENSVKAVSGAADYFEISDRLYTASAKLADTDVLPMLDRVLGGPEQNTLIVLHTYGSHVYFEDRYYDEHRVYTPICVGNFLECPEENLVNSYDNTIIATDSYLAEVMARLKDKNAALFITADHGISLQERRGHVPGTHSMAIAPLRMVPFLFWFSPGFEHAELMNTARANQEKRVSHDMIFHSLLGVADIDAPVIREDTLNIFSSLLRPHTDPYISEEAAGGVPHR